MQQKAKQAPIMGSPESGPLSLQLQVLNLQQVTRLMNQSLQIDTM